jgi:hypothetical protein
VTLSVPHRSSPHLLLINAVVDFLAERAQARGIPISTLVRQVFERVENGDLDFDSLCASVLPERHDEEQT